MAKQANPTAGNILDAKRPGAAASSLPGADSSDTKETKESRKQAGRVNHAWLTVLAIVSCFSITLVACLGENLWGDAPRTTFMFDARHYLESCRQLTMLWQQAVSTHLFDLSKLVSGRDPWFSDFLMLDGPILPLTAVPIFAFLHKIPTQTDWKVFVMLGAVMQAFSSVLVYFIAAKLTRKRLWGFAAGLCWGIYPSAIWASGQYLTETPTTLLLVASVVLSWLIFKVVLPGRALAHAEQTAPVDAAAAAGANELSGTNALIGANRLNAGVSIGVGVLSGVINALLLLMKPAVLPVWSGILLLALILPDFLLRFSFQVRQAQIPTVFSLKITGITLTRILPCAIGLVIGAGLIFVPWLMFSKQITGQYCLLPQRVPSFNLAKGFDLEADGWSAEPTPPLTDAITRSQHPFTDVLKVVSAHPTDTASLFSRKIARLWQSPWNDFRREVLGIPLAAQQWWHTLLCLLAILGSISVMARICLLPRPGQSILEPEQVFLGAAVVYAVIGHLAFLPFETISRYAFTSMPFVGILVCYYLAWLTADIRAQLFSVRYLWALLAAVIATLVTLNCDLVPQIVSLTHNFKLSIWIGSLAQLAVYLNMLFFCLKGLKTVDWLACSEAERLSDCLLNSPKVPAHAFTRAVFASFVACLMIVPAAMAFSYACDGYDLASWSTQLQPSESAVRVVDLSQRKQSSAAIGSAFVLVDAGGATQNAVVSVNGYQLTEKLQPVFEVYEPRYYLLGLLRKYAAAMNKPIEAFDQWRVVSVPVDKLNLQGKNTLSVAAISATGGSQPVKVYGEYLVGNGASTVNRLCNLDWFSPGRICGRHDNLDSRLSGQLVNQLTYERSMLLASGKETASDLSNQPGEQLGRYRIFLVLGTEGSGVGQKPGGTAAAGSLRASANASGDALAGSSAAHAMPGAGEASPARPVASVEFSQKLTPAMFDKLLRCKVDNLDALCINRQIVQAAAGTFCGVTIPASLSNGNYIHVSISGFVKGIAGKPSASILPVLVSGSNPPIVITLPKAPPSLPAGKSWQQFEIDGDVPTSTIKGGLQSVTVGIYPGRSDEIAEYGFDRANGASLLKDLQLTVKSETVKTFPAPGNRFIY